jgi:hypothetical protein
MREMRRNWGKGGGGGAAASHSSFPFVLRLSRPSEIHWNTPRPRSLTFTPFTHLPACVIPLDYAY